MMLSLLTTSGYVVIIDNMKAELVVDHKTVDARGGIVRLTVWKVPIPVPPAEHGFKYRLVYAFEGQRIVGFDNERGKGDHMHLDGRELPYQFISLERLIEDFISEVDKRRKSL